MELYSENILTIRNGTSFEFKYFSNISVTAKKMVNIVFWS